MVRVVALRSAQRDRLAVGGFGERPRRVVQAQSGELHLLQCVVNASVVLLCRSPPRAGAPAGAYSVSRMVTAWKPCRPAGSGVAAVHVSVAGSYASLRSYTPPRYSPPNT